MQAINDNSPCPCGSKLVYGECCGPLHHAARKAETAEELMRSRYSAFVLDNEFYLQLTWHPSTRPVQVLGNDNNLTEWLGLNIIDCQQGQAGDNKGSVEFIARFKVQKQAGQLHEVSSFVFEDEQWFYVDGELKKGNTIRNTSKVGRNDPCPCGSGKKHKKCCG